MIKQVCMNIKLENIIKDTKLTSKRNLSEGVFVVQPTKMYDIEN